MSNNLPEKQLTMFQSNVEPLVLPKTFTYPFCYQPHPLALQASHELQNKLALFHPIKSKQQGRMYGVLVVKNPRGELGYLAAISGQELSIDTHVLTDNLSLNLVPSVCKSNIKGEFERRQQAEINTINQLIAQLQAAPQRIKLHSLLEKETGRSKQQIQNLQRVMRHNKSARKQKRAWLSNSGLPAEEIKQISISLARESVTDKKALLALKESCNKKLTELHNDLLILTDEINALKKSRKRLSTKLQKHLFKQYQLLNSQGEAKDLIELFKETIQQKPPAGAGDCAAPKLLQHAFKNKLQPVCMAEFWWGAQPKSEIRKHKHFYPACQGKCQPILAHMLSGMAIDDNPLLKNPAAGKKLDIVFQDEHVIVVNKPANLLSVPGKSITDSVYTRIKAMFPLASGSLIIHRLDMATSGLLMLALNKRAHKNLQLQFINKEVSKRYVAIISGKLTKKEGTICLPLRGDFNDRPRQLVCYEHGKHAETTWKIIEEIKGKTKLFLYPITGRTHQLRMHCAHPKGLNMPIVGDDLYGTSDSRLYLHAQQLSFIHPISKQRLTFSVKENF